MVPVQRSSDRRAFLRLLAASPVLAAAGVVPGWIERLLAAEGQLEAGREALAAAHDRLIIKSVREALSVFDFEPLAKQKLSPAHYNFLTVGAYNNETLIANREAFSKYQVRMRWLTGIDRPDPSVTLFGTTWASPLYLCPIGRMNAFHAEGNVAVARAARATNTVQVMSSGTMQSVEEVTKARGGPIWFQLYTNGDWKATEATLKRVEAAGSPAVVWTIDNVADANQSGALAAQSVGVPNLDRSADPRCRTCHTGLAARPNETAGRLTDRERPAFTWDDVERVKAMSGMKLLLKGIVSREDAELAVRHGIDGVVVSNHGGHVDAGGRASLDSLPEVVAGAAGRIPVLFDSGVRNGVDVFKALALGATAVGVGRPYVWGLAAFGDEGAATAIELVRHELRIIMTEAGAASIAKISRASLVSRS